MMVAESQRIGCVRAQRGRVIFQSNTRTTRKPKWKLQLTGATLARFDERQTAGKLIQQPPRKTRRSPFAGPSWQSEVVPHIQPLEHSP
jgi:hypothetical protein